MSAKTVAWLDPLSGHLSKTSSAEWCVALVSRDDYDAEHTRAEQLAARCEQHLIDKTGWNEQAVLLNARAERAEAALMELAESKDALEAAFGHERYWQPALLRYNVSWAAARAIVEGKFNLPTAT